MAASLESTEQQYHYHQDHLPLPVMQDASPSAVVTTKINKNSFPRTSHSPLNFHRDSRTITKSQRHKIGSSSRATTGEAQEEKDEVPTIIYTLDPKVIHTKPEDFKDLVQKLTGMPKPQRATPSDPLLKRDYNTPSLLSEQNVVAFNPMGNTNTTTKNNHNNLNMNMNNNNNYYNYYDNNYYNNSSNENASISTITDKRYGYSYRGDILGEPSFGIMPPLFDSATQGGTSIDDFMPSTFNLIPYATEPFGYDHMNS